MNFTVGSGQVAGVPFLPFVVLAERLSRSPAVVRFLVKLGLGLGADQASGGVITKHLLDTVKFMRDATNGALRDRYQKAYDELIASGVDPKDITVILSTEFKGWWRDP